MGEVKVRPPWQSFFRKIDIHGRLLDSEEYFLNLLILKQIFRLEEVHSGV